MKNITIRAEIPSDIQSIHEVTVAAFLKAPHADHTEQFIVKALRDSGALAVSLVAETSAGVVGHVAVSPVTISNGCTGWYGLGPISVIPGEQGKGIGSRLMRAAIAQLEDLGANGCVLLGDPGYYSRFGFEPKASLILPNVPPEYFQAKLLQGEYPTGSVKYHESFSAQG
jgi:putative acetyltransferase